MNKDTATDVIVEIISKVIGILICVVGIGVWYADYLVFRAIGALCGHLASLVGITGEASIGVMIIGWVIGLGLMATIALIGVFVCAFGVGAFMEES